MKENLKSEIEKYEIMRLSSIKSKTYVKNQMKNSQKYFMPSTKFIFFPCVCRKCFKSANKNIKKCKIEIIDKERYFWVNRKDLEIESDVANWAQIFDKCDSKKQKYRPELTPNAEYHRCRVFVQNDLLRKKLKPVENHQKDF